jgi:hypothetical protein
MLYIAEKSPRMTAGNWPQPDVPSIPWRIHPSSIRLAVLVSIPNSKASILTSESTSIILSYSPRCFDSGINFEIINLYVRQKMVGQASIPPPPVGTSLAGKTVIVTGGNSGIGHETARQYLTLGASRIIITVRSETKGQESISALRTDPAVKAANPSAEIEAFQLDLSDYRSALQFCQRVKSEISELDILLFNAGLNIVKYEESKSGHEMVMQGKPSK